MCAISVCLVYGAQLFSQNLKVMAAMFSEQQPWVQFNRRVVTSLHGLLGNLPVVGWPSGLLPWCVCMLVCSSPGVPWPTGALLSDWQLAGELYDGAVSPAVSLSLAVPLLTLRNTSECNFSLILPELSFEGKNSSSFHFQNCPGKRNGDLNIEFRLAFWWRLLVRQFQKEKVWLVFPL